jgi:hypothetical protein
MDGLVLGFGLIAFGAWLFVRRHAPAGRTVVSIPLRESVLCASCDSITPSKHSTCQVCGSSALLSLAKALQPRVMQPLTPQEAEFVDRVLLPHCVGFSRSWAVGPRRRQA